MTRLVRTVVAFLAAILCGVLAFVVANPTGATESFKTTTSQPAPTTVVLSGYDTYAKLLGRVDTAASARSLTTPLPDIATVGGLLPKLGVAAEDGGGLLARLRTVASGDAGSMSIPFKSPWGWSGSGSYRAIVNAVDEGGTLEELGGVIPTQAQAEQLIEDSGGTILRIEGPHAAPNPHQFPHINYTTSGGLKGTLQIQGLAP